MGVRKIASREEKERVAASAKFIANMASPAFVAQLLTCSGIQKPPCQFCLRNKNETCEKIVGDVECQDFIPYTTSPKKLEEKVIGFITGAHQHDAHVRKENKQRLAA